MDARRSIAWWRTPLPRWAEAAALILILTLAACMRLYMIGQVPPGPHYDESAAALDALDVLAGRHMIFSPRSYGREMLFVYVASPLIALLGPSRLALRLPIALVGVLTVLATYLLARELFHREDKRKVQGTALLAALFLALSFWHLALNHLTFRANYLPLTETLCFLFLWRAVRTGRLGDYVAGGILLGLSLHTYASARFVPIVLVTFFAALVLTREGRKMILPRWSHWLLFALVGLLVFAPLLIFYVTHPEDFMMRLKGVSILNPTLHQGDLWGLFVRSLLGNMGLFGFTGDSNWVYNIPGRPGLDPVQAGLFWIGVVLCLIRWRRPRYLFLPVWWLVMLLPSILAPDPIPHSLRAIGTLPVASILAAWALTELVSFLIRKSRGLWIGVPLALLTLLPLYLGWAGYNTWHSYFDLWAPREEVYYAYYGHMADLARQINADSDPEAVYIFPVNYDRRGDEYSEYTLELLYQGPVPFRYILVDKRTVAQDLTAICAGKKRIRLIVWTHGEHVDADPRQVLPFYLEAFGRQTEKQVSRGYQIVTYELASTNVNFAPPDFAPIQGVFGNHLALVAEAHEQDVPSGDPAWVALRWRVGHVPDDDYKASLRLRDRQGHLIGQSDATLLSNEHRLTSQWQTGQVVTTYHLLPSLDATLPGRYYLELLVYDPKTSRPIRVVDAGNTSATGSLSLGELKVDRPWRQQPPEPEVVLASTRLAPGLDLVGYDLHRRQFSPGETIDLALYWRTAEKITQDYSIVAQLTGVEGRVVADWTKEPVYRTSLWQTGDVWRDWHALQIPANLSPGEYQLSIQLAG
ncbi:MAG: glycosyltransferase family 39 protein, partial [Anaerolineae bacterium]